MSKERILIPESLLRDLEALGLREGLEKDHEIVTPLGYAELRDRLTAASAEVDRELSTRWPPPGQGKSVDIQIPKEELQRQIDQTELPEGNRFQEFTKARIQAEMAAVRESQNAYEAYCEQEQAADRIPKDFAMWQRDRLLASFH